MLTGEPRVVGVTTKPELRKILEGANVDTLGSAFTTITWSNRLILGIAYDRHIEAIGFYGENSDKTFPQPLAAKSIVMALSQLEGAHIYTKLFDAQYEEVLDHMQTNKGMLSLDK